MARRLGADPGLGLLQTLPAIIRGRSLFARLQQFANRCYGPIFGNGLAAWHGRGSNFWGHNAIIRTKAFADAAGLPRLKGEPPFGGSVLSHDFVEAALLCRAGWGVRLDTDLAESHEEAPPSLLDVMVRDRRWCQGNLQHVRFLFARGLSFTSRMHLFSGMMAYLSAPLWFALVIVGLLIAVQAGITRPEYFAEPSLFPTWPVFDAKRAVSLFVVSMAVVLTPKALGWLAVMLHPHRLMRFGGPLAVTASVLVELLFSILYAPILMVAQSHIVYDVLTGRDSGWTTQRRGDGTTAFADALRAHRWHMTLGAALALIASQVNTDLFFWLLPLTAGLILAPFLSWLSASTAFGGMLGKLAILRTPEERRRSTPSIIDRYESRLADFALPPSGAGPIGRLLDDEKLCEWHLAQLEAGGEGEAGFDPALVLARAKAESASDIAALEKWLSPAEAMALLHDRSFIATRCRPELAPSLAS
jgi:membrane glycosyltransferase